MTKRLACPPAPGPLEDYAAQFDPLFARLAQRRGLRAYLQGLLLPRDRNKTMTALAGAEPVVGAQHAAVQGLQWFLTESSWDNKRVNQRRVELLVADLVEAAPTAVILFRAVVADCFYGDNEGFCAALGGAGVAYVLAVKPRKGAWAPEEETHTPQEAARQLRWSGPEQPGDWAPVTRRFRDGHTETWWAADASLPAAGWGPDRRIRLVVATTDPATLPKLTTWYLVTNLRRPGRQRASASAAFPAADLAEVVRLYSLRNWVEQGYKQVKHELGWADFQVRSDRAIRRHWTLVACAFSFCWRAWFAEHPPPRPRSAEPAADEAAVRGEGTGQPGGQARDGGLAGDAPPGARLADPVGRAGTLVAGVVGCAPAAPAAIAA